MLFFSFLVTFWGFFSNARANGLTVRNRFYRNLISQLLLCPVWSLFEDFIEPFDGPLTLRRFDIVYEFIQDVELLQGIEFYKL